MLITGNRVRVTVKLIHGASDRQLWDSSEQSLDDVLALQTEVARAIAAQIRVAVTAEEARYLGRSSRVNPAAYQQVLQGNYHLARGAPGALEKAQDYFEQAIEHDPQILRPTARRPRGRVVQLATMDGLLPAGAVHAPATAAAQKALALDPSLAEGYIALGRIKSRLEWDWAAADAALQAGYAARPSSSLARLQYANYLTAVGRFEESIAIGTRTVELDPLLPRHTRSWDWRTTSPDDTTKLSKCTEEPGIGSGDQVLSLPSGRSIFAGRKNDRCDQWPRTHSHVGRRRRAATPRGVPWATCMERRVTAPRLFAQSASSVGDQRPIMCPPSSIGNIYVGLNRREDALDNSSGHSLSATLGWGGSRVHPLYDEIRSHPRFQELIKRMKFPG